MGECRATHGAQNLEVSRLWGSGFGGCWDFGFRVSGFRDFGFRVSVFGAFGLFFTVFRAQVDCQLRLLWEGFEVAVS